jgi:nucleoid-associated protein YgaU
MSTNQFPANSRYNGIPTTTLAVPDGQGQAGASITYLKRRFVPQPGDFFVIQKHTVVQGDRLDNIAAKYLGDPLLFWRLCDANGVIRPEELVETPGTTINITLPAGVSGPPSPNT